MKKEWEKAIADCSEAIRLEPRVALAYANRGMAWQKKGQYDKALGDLNEAVRLNPRNALGYNNLAWLRATCLDAKYRNGQQAVESATHACELTRWREAYELGTLAAAYAEAATLTPPSSGRPRPMRSTRARRQDEGRGPAEALSGEDALSRDEALNGANAGGPLHATNDRRCASGRPDRRHARLEHQTLGMHMVHTSPTRQRGSAGRSEADRPDARAGDGLGPSLAQSGWNRGRCTGRMQSLR